MAGEHVGAVLARQVAPIRILVFLLLLLLLWLPFAAPIQWVAWQLESQQLPLVALGILYLAFLGLLRFWRRLVHQDEQPFYSCGLRLSRRFWIQLVQGFGIGCLGVGVLFGVELGLGWASWISPESNMVGLALEGLVTAIAVGFCEEMFFRGWLLTELEQGYTPFWALFVSSALFMIAHYLKPLAVILETWPQGVGLFLLGLALGWAKRACQPVRRGLGDRPPKRSKQPSKRGSLERSGGGSLGAAMGLHGGLVWSYYLVSVGNLIDYAPHVPDWVVGIDRNPLAGLLGIVLLGGIGGYYRFGRDLRLPQ